MSSWYASPCSLGALAIQWDQIHRACLIGDKARWAANGGHGSPSLAGFRFSGIQVYVRQKECRMRRSLGALSPGRTETEIHFSGARTGIATGRSVSVSEMRTATATTDATEVVVAKIVKSFEVSSLRECISGSSRQARQRNSRPPRRQTQSEILLPRFGTASIDTRGAEHESSREIATDKLSGPATCGPLARCDASQQLVCWVGNGPAAPTAEPDIALPFRPPYGR